VREIEGLREVFSPYGIGGFVGSPPKDFFSQWNNWMASQGFVTAYLLQHPAFPFLESQGCWQRARPLFLMDLEEPLEALSDKLHTTHRYEIRKMQQEAGLEVLVGNAPDLKEAFLALYPEAMRRVGASGTYHFNEKTLRALMDMPGSLLTGVRKDGDVCAAALFLSTPACAEYFLSAASPGGRKYSRLLVWKAVEILQRQKVSKLHLGGGIKAGDELEHFKRRFGGKELIGLCLKDVFRKAEYEKLCGARGVKPSAEGFFPPYWASR
jgi:hypothetical protein